MGETASRWLPLLFLVTVAPVGLSAGVVFPTGYSTINGGAGTYAYTDLGYSACPAGSCATPYAPLSGGSGQLSDGIAPAGNWYEYDSGAWVGWYYHDPAITFNFSGASTIDHVSLYLDNTPGFGDVRLPLSVTIAGVNYAVEADDDWGPRWVDFHIPAYEGEALTIVLNADPGYGWSMLGEAKFSGVQETAGVVTPEPGTFALLTLSLLIWIGWSGLVRVRRASDSKLERLFRAGAERA